MYNNALVLILNLVVAVSPSRDPAGAAPWGTSGCQAAAGRGIVAPPNNLGSGWFSPRPPAARFARNPKGENIPLSTMDQGSSRFRTGGVRPSGERRWISFQRSPFKRRAERNSSAARCVWHLRTHTRITSEQREKECKWMLLNDFRRAKRLDAGPRKPWR